MWRDKPRSPEQIFYKTDKFPFYKNYDNNKNILQPKTFDHSSKLLYQILYIQMINEGYINIFDMLYRPMYKYERYIS